MLAFGRGLWYDGSSRSCACGVELKATTKSILKSISRRMPHHLWVPSLYWKTRKLLEETERWSNDRIREYQLLLLREMLIHCGKNVPYYRRLFRELSFDPQNLRDLEGIRALPTLDRETLLAHPQDFLAENIPVRKRAYFTTGGTMGRPLGIYNSKDSGWRELAFMHTQWKRVGFKQGDLRAMLKGAIIERKRHWQYDSAERAFVFSNFHMTAHNVAEYADVMKRQNTIFLHTYPSAALDFARLLKDQGIEPPPFRAILAGSENLYAGQREFLEAFFHCRVYTWFGHSENTVLAGGCEVSNCYHVFAEYGFVEVLREDGTVAVREGEHGEIVGTSLYNPVMPLVRYRTGDYAEIGRPSCACGRPYVLLGKVFGRWHQEMLIGKCGNLISITALNFHTGIFDNVRQFQLVQREIGKVEVRLVRKPGYTDEDTRRIYSSLSEKIGESMEIAFTFHESIAVTERGKYRYIVQELPVPRVVDVAAAPERNP